jgi:hypothetical protein
MPNFEKLVADAMAEIAEFEANSVVKNIDYNKKPSNQKTKKTRKIFRLKTMTVDIKYKTRTKILIWKVTF